MTNIAFVIINRSIGTHDKCLSGTNVSKHYLRLKHLKPLQQLIQTITSYNHCDRNALIMNNHHES